MTAGDDDGAGTAGEPKTIDAIYAWIARDPYGGEGVCSALLGTTHYPLVGADIERAQSLRPYALTIRAATGYPVTLARFSRREDLEQL